MNKEAVADSKPDKSRSHKMATISSAVLWILGFGLAFVIPPGSPLIWLPDFLLLTGFIPVLLIWRPGWPWLVFGGLNFFIGFVLEAARWLPDNQLPAEMVRVRMHLAEYHAPLVWMFVGAVSSIFGCIRITKNLYRKMSARNGQR